MYHGVCLSHKKERNCVIWRDTDGPRDGDTDYGKSEKQIYVNACLWKLEKMVEMNLPEYSSRETDVENK